MTIQKNKNDLIWKEMTQVRYDWKSVIIINKNNEVVAGNFLKDSLGDVVNTFVIDTNPALEEAFYNLETLISKENNLRRIETFHKVTQSFFYYELHPIEKLSLFDLKDDGLISEDTYRRPPLMSYRNNDSQKEDEPVIKKKEIDFDIDLEIMKELL